MLRRFLKGLSLDWTVRACLRVCSYSCVRAHVAMCVRLSISVAFYKCVTL